MAFLESSLNEETQIQLVTKQGTTITRSRIAKSPSFQTSCLTRQVTEWLVFLTQSSTAQCAVLLLLCGLTKESEGEGDRVGPFYQYTIFDQAFCDTTRATRTGHEAK